MTALQINLAFHSTARLWQLVGTAINLELDWFTEDDIYNGLRRIGYRISRRQLISDRNQIRTIIDAGLLHPDYFDKQKQEEGYSRQSAITLIVYRLLVADRNATQAVKNLHFVVKIIGDKFDDFSSRQGYSTPKQSNSGSDQDQQITVEAKAI